MKLLLGNRILDTNSFSNISCDRPAYIRVPCVYMSLLNSDNGTYIACDTLDEAREIYQEIYEGIKNNIAAIDIQEIQQRIRARNIKI